MLSLSHIACSPTALFLDKIVHCTLCRLPYCLQNVPIKQREALSYVGQIEEAMVKGFPFSVPPEYANRPLLLVS